jgi:hypothetical protein
MNQQERDNLLMETHATVKVLDERTTEQGKQIDTIFRRTERQGKQGERNSTMIRVICGVGGAAGAVIAAVFAWMFLR